MSRTLRKTANRLAADGRTAVPRFSTDAGEIRGQLPQLEQVYRQRDHVHGRASDLDDAARQQTWRHRVGDLADAGVLSSPPWRSTASSRPTRWASTTTRRTGCSRAGSSPGGRATRPAGTSRHWWSSAPLPMAASRPSTG